MATTAALPYVGASGDYKTHHTISAPASLYIMKANLIPATGNAVPPGSTLDNDSESGADATQFADDNSSSIIGSGLMDYPEMFGGALVATLAVPDRNGACIGLTTGGIQLRKEQDTVVFSSDQLRGAYDEDATSHSWAVDVSLHQMSLWNLALAWGRSTAAIGSSSMMLLKAGDQEFHSMALWTKGPQKDYDNSVGAYRRAKRIYQFFKVKAWSNGAIPHTREDTQSLPTTFATYCDGNENWGLVIDGYKDFDTAGSSAAQRIVAPDYNLAVSE